MAFINVEVTFRIFDSYSLKDKRRTVQSIIQRMKRRHSVSLAEIGQQDMLNLGQIGIALVNESPVIANKILERVLNDIEEEYEIEIVEVNQV